VPAAEGQSAQVTALATAVGTSLMGAGRVPHRPSHTGARRSSMA
jgi:hypothetical protein